MGKSEFNQETVHLNCYEWGRPEKVEEFTKSPSTNWKCESCADPDGGAASRSCQLCNFQGGIFRKTAQGGWVHLICALWIPELYVDGM